MWFTMQAGFWIVLGWMIELPTQKLAHTQAHPWQVVLEQDLIKAFDPNTKGHWTQIPSKWPRHLLYLWSANQFPPHHQLPTHSACCTFCAVLYPHIISAQQLCSKTAGCKTCKCTCLTTLPTDHLVMQQYFMSFCWCWSLLHCTPQQRLIAAHF